MENSEWFDIWTTCYLITAGPYAKRIIEIATLDAEKLLIILIVDVSQVFMLHISFSDIQIKAQLGSLLHVKEACEVRIQRIHDGTDEYFTAAAGVGWIPNHLQNGLNLTHVYHRTEELLIQL